MIAVYSYEADQVFILRYPIYCTSYFDWWADSLVCFLATHFACDTSTVHVAAIGVRWFFCIHPFFQQMTLPKMVILWNFFVQNDSKSSFLKFFDSIFRKNGHQRDIPPKDRDLFVIGSLACLDRLANFKTFRFGVLRTSTDRRHLARIPRLCFSCEQKESLETTRDEPIK